MTTKAGYGYPARPETSAPTDDKPPCFSGRGKSKDGLLISSSLLNRQITRLIPTRLVYISIDKDILRPEDAVTNWEQGEMPLSVLLQLLRTIIGAREVWGADVCGEPRLHPLDTLRPAGREAVRKNAQANALITLSLLAGTGRDAQRAS